MPEQDLNRAKVGASFEQMRGVAMAQGMRTDSLFDPGFAYGFLAEPPDYFVADRLMSTPPVVAGEKIILRLFSKPNTHAIRSAVCC